MIGQSSIAFVAGHASINGSKRDMSNSLTPAQMAGVRETRTTGALSHYKGSRARPIQWLAKNRATRVVMRSQGGDKN